MSGASIVIRFASLAAVFSLAPGLAVAQKDALPKGGLPEPQGEGLQTQRDVPGDLNKYFGQSRNQYKDIGRRLAKIDLDGDFNYDGVIDNDDPADNGAFQQTPPGLVLGTGELSKLVIRIRPYHYDFDGKAVVSIQVDGINRAHKSGQFASSDEEQASVGHIKVWRDASRRELILDSQDPTRRVYEWSIDDSKYPKNVPGIVPRTLYVEGISESGEYNGDIRLLLLVQHRARGAAPPPVDGPKGGLDPKGGLNPKGGLDPKSGLDPKGAIPEEGRKTKRVKFKRFSTAYDHILLTVQGAPHAKEFVNGNNSGVWKRR